jgi:hypothetical protein
MIKYPKTGQFRTVIQTVKTNHDFKGKDKNDEPVYNHETPYPTLTFEASVKIHGTNAGIVFKRDGEIEYQSRERKLSVMSDNADFMQSMLTKDLQFIKDFYNFEDTLVVYGEWCGGNIQKGVAVSNLKEKIFIIFAVYADGEFVALDKDLHDTAQKIYNIYDFPTWKIDIDFNNPLLAQNKIVELTLVVEDKCPVGEYFGYEGVGEGIVLRCVSRPDLFFKSKGEKHSSSKVTKLAEIDPEKLQSADKFVEYAVTENRLNQGLEHFELDVKNVGGFIRWLINDVISEELDTLLQSGLTVKDVNKQMSQKAKEFFFKQLNSQV